jgi:hypothetical protein
VSYKDVLLNALHELLLLPKNVLLRWPLKRRVSGP